MSRSPYRLRGDPAECWRAILFGEILRAVDAPALVQDTATIRLPRSGRWESGLGKITPALDDALGATAFAVAWRWSCAEVGANAWPSWELIARKALDQPVRVAPGVMLAKTERVSIQSAFGVRTWRLELSEAIDIGVSDSSAADWSEVDRIADVTAAWLDAPWRVLTLP